MPSPLQHFPAEATRVTKALRVFLSSQENQVVRISFSNLFKEFKSTATWLQFPFICGAAKGSVYDRTARASRRGEERAWCRRCCLRHSWDQAGTSLPK